MSWIRAMGLPVAGFLFAGTAGSVLAYDDPAAPLPCNSLCQRWMGLSSDPAEAPARKTPAEDASGPQAEPVVAAKPGPPIPLVPAAASASKAFSERRVQTAIPKNPPKKRIAVSAPVRNLIVPARAVVVARTQAAPLPMPPAAHPVSAPAAPSVALPTPERSVPHETPFEPVASIDPVQQMVDLQPSPPPAPHVDVVALAASPAQTSTPMITMMAPAVADPAPPILVAKAEPTAVAAPEPAIVAEPPKSALQKKRESAPLASASWPPPIDVIGAILMQTPASRPANATADASP